MIFKAKNKAGVSVDKKSLPDIKNITESKEESSGYLLIEGNSGVYLPNNIENLNSILSYNNQLVSLIGDIHNLIKTLPPASADGVGCETCQVEGQIITTKLKALKQDISNLQQKLK